MTARRSAAGAGSGRREQIRTWRDRFLAEGFDGLWIARSQPSPQAATEQLLILLATDATRFTATPERSTVDRCTRPNISSHRVRVTSEPGATPARRVPIERNAGHASTKPSLSYKRAKIDRHDDEEVALVDAASDGRLLLRQPAPTLRHGRLRYFARGRRRTTADPPDRLATALWLYYDDRGRFRVRSPPRPRRHTLTARLAGRPDPNWGEGGGCHSRRMALPVLRPAARVPRPHRRHQCTARRRVRDRSECRAADAPRRLRTEVHPGSRSSPQCRWQQRAEQRRRSVRTSQYQKGDCRLDELGLTNPFDRPPTVDSWDGLAGRFGSIEY